MPARRPTKTARRQGRELLRPLRPRFPALFPKALEGLKPWAVGEAEAVQAAMELAEREEELARLKAARHAAAKRAKAKAAELETRTT